MSPDNIVTILLSTAIVHLWRRDVETKNDHKQNMEAIVKDRDACEARYKSLDTKVWELTKLLIKGKKTQDALEDELGE
jgi:hypothetical protein